MSNRDWEHDALALAKAGVMSWREIAEYVEKPKSTVSDFLRNYFTVLAPTDKFGGLGYDKIWVDELMEDAEHDNSRVLILSDMHIPYHHKGLLPFLEGLKTRYEPTRVICVGDELDKHAMSFHDSDPDLDSAGPELAKSLPVVKELEKLFPQMDLIDSNHGSMVYRKAKHHGIPRAYIRPYNEVLQVGDGWKWHFDLTITIPGGQQVYFHHGKNADAVKVSQTMGMSHVCGHYHESFGVKYWSSPAGLFWGMNTGCLIDRKSYAFAYANTNLKRQIIGTGLIIDGIPILEAMPL